MLEYLIMNGMYPTEATEEQERDNQELEQMIEEMDNKTMDLPKEKVENGIHYTLGPHHLYYPDELPDENEAKIGLTQYGMQCFRYLQAEHNHRWTHLLLTRQLNAVCKQVEEEAWERHHEIEDAYLKKYPITKEMEFMEVVQRRNQARAYAMEIVMDEVVNQYH